MDHRILSIAALLVMGCVGQPSDKTCEIGRTVDCTCESGERGTQTCQSSGIFSECRCVSSQDTTDDTTPTDVAEDTAETDAATDTSATDTSATDTSATDTSATDTSATDTTEDTGAAETTDGASEDTASDTSSGLSDEPIAWSWPNPYSAGATSFVTRLVLDDACCLDFGDISKNAGVDNALASLAVTLRGYGFNTQAAYDTLITGCSMSDPDTPDDPWDDTRSCQICTANAECGSGSCIDGACEGASVVQFLFDHHDLQPEPDALLIATLGGVYTNGTDYATASAGQGSFVLDASSFLPDGATPRAVFNPVHLEGGAMVTAQPATAGIVFPLLGLPLLLESQETRVGGAVTVDSDGVTYTEGELSGYVSLEAFADGINTTINEICGACYQWVCETDADCELGSCEDEVCNTPQAIYSVSVEGQLGDNCPDSALSSCPAVCTEFLGDFISPCELAPTVIEGQLDIDSDSNGVYDALSVGLRFQAVPATVVP